MDLNSFKIPAIGICPILADAIINGFKTTKDRAIKVTSIPGNHSNPKTWKNKIVLIVASDEFKNGLEAISQLPGTKVPDRKNIRTRGLVGISKIKSVEYNNLILKNSISLPFFPLKISRKTQLFSLEQDLPSDIQRIILDYIWTKHDPVQTYYNRSRTNYFREYPLILSSGNSEEGEFPLTDSGEVYIKFSELFSANPGGRYAKDHSRPGLSGEEFRENFLIPALKTGRKVLIDLSGVFGVAASFQDEVFGVLIRACTNLQQAKNLLASIEFQDTDSRIIDSIVSLMNENFQNLQERFSSIDLSKQKEILEEVLF